MGLKVQIGGNKVGITAPARPPVIFVNGVKKRLSRGVTFIGGNKVTLWGNVGLLVEKIDYPVFDSYGTPQVFYVSRNKAYIGGRGAGASAGNVQKLDISNPSAPKQDSYIQWGGNITYSADESTQEKAVFYGVVAGSSLKGNRIVIENDVASVDLGSPVYSIGGGYAGVYIDGWLMATLGTVLGTDVDGRVFFNGVDKYSTGTTAGVVITRYDNTSALVPSGVKVKKWTATGASDFSTRTTTALNLMEDGDNVLVCDALGVSLVDGSGTDIWRYNFDSRTESAFVVGRIRDYYVVYENKQIVALNVDDGLVYIKESAPKTFNMAYTTPHVSNTGYLGIGDGYNGFYRISIV